MQEGGLQRRTVRLAGKAANLIGRNKYKILTSANKVQPPSPLATLVSWSVLTLAMQAPITEPLHLLFLLPQMIFPKNFKWQVLSIHPGAQM